MPFGGERRVGVPHVVFVRGCGGSGPDGRASLFFVRRLMVMVAPFGPPTHPNETSICRSSVDRAHCGLGPVDAPERLSRGGPRGGF